MARKRSATVREGIRPRVGTPGFAIGDARWKGRRKELTCVRELLCDAMLGGREYGSDLAALDRYFYPFAVAARAGR